MFDLSPLSYSFFVTALVCGAAIAVCAALVGTHLTLKGYSMLGDGLSHVGFGSVAIAAAAGIAPLAVAIPVVILAAFLLLAAGRGRRLPSESAVAMLSAASLAVGIIAVSLSGTNFDLNAYLFGSVLAVEKSEMPLVLVLCGAVIGLYLISYPAFFELTYDEEFAAAKGRRVAVIRALLSALCAVVVVLGMQSAGALLISALLIFPPQSAMRFASSFRASVLLAAVFALFSFVLGLFLSFYLSLPAGAAVVVVSGLVYLVSRLFGRRKN